MKSIPSCLLQNRVYNCVILPPTPHNRLCLVYNKLHSLLLKKAQVERRGLWGHELSHNALHPLIFAKERGKLDYLPAQAVFHCKRGSSLLISSESYNYKTSYDFDKMLDSNTELIINSRIYLHNLIDKKLGYIETNIDTQGLHIKYGTLGITTPLDFEKAVNVKYILILLNYIVYNILSYKPPHNPAWVTMNTTKELNSTFMPTPLEIESVIYPTPPEIEYRNYYNFY